MTLRKQCTAGVLMAMLVFAAAPVHGAAVTIPGLHKKKEPKDPLAGRKLTPEQSALVDKGIAREKETVKIIKDRAPLVEIYVQVMKPDVALQQVPDHDEHWVERVEFNKVIGNDEYVVQTHAKMGLFKGVLSHVTNLSGALKLHFNAGGFVRMVVIDSTKFDRQHYDFAFVRREFLGTVHCSVFDVQPHKGNRAGYFFGRIWIEEEGGNIVRFNGDLNGGSDEDIFDHFDSWRTNIQPNVWLPTSFYVEETQTRDKEHSVSKKAVGHIWGYVLKVPSKESENNSMEIEKVQDVSSDAQDVSPLGAQRAWVQQAEDNVVDRLFQAGLLDGPSDFDKVCADIANNIVIENKIDTSSPIKCRILLTTPLESLAIGNTILLSKGLVDTLAVQTQDPQAAIDNLAAFIAFETAHVILAHRLDTKFAFNDRLLFPDDAAFVRIPMHHTDIDNEEAAKRAVELLNGSEFKDKLNFPGLYLEQLAARVRSLPDLNRAMIGDPLIKDEKDYTFWMQALVSKGEKLDIKDLKQNAAMPLNGFLKYDPWTDQVLQMNARYEPLLNSRDKMPFEITPVYLKLTYYKPPVDATTVPATPAAGADPNAAPANGTATPTATAPPAQGTATPPAATTPAADTPPAQGTSNPPPTGGLN